MLPIPTIKQLGCHTRLGHLKLADTPCICRCTEIDQKEKKIEIFFVVVPLVFGACCCCCTMLYRYRKILVVQKTRGLILQIPTFQLVPSGSLRSGLLGNPIGILHFLHFCIHPFHPWHKCLDWSSPKSKNSIL